MRRSFGSIVPLLCLYTACIAVAVLAGCTLPDIPKVPKPAAFEAEMLKQCKAAVNAGGGKKYGRGGCTPRMFGAIGAWEDSRCHAAGRRQESPDPRDWMIKNHPHNAKDRCPRKATCKHATGAGLGGMFGADVSKLQVDHKGSDSRDNCKDNFQWMHGDCNNSKGGSNAPYFATAMKAALASPTLKFTSQDKIDEFQKAVKALGKSKAKSAEKMACYDRLMSVSTAYQEQLRVLAQWTSVDGAKPALFIESDSKMSVASSFLNHAESMSSAAAERAHFATQSSSDATPTDLASLKADVQRRLAKRKEIAADIDATAKELLSQAKTACETEEKGKWNAASKKCDADKGKADCEKKAGAKWDEKTKKCDDKKKDDKKKKDKKKDAAKDKKKTSAAAKSKDKKKDKAKSKKSKDAAKGKRSGKKGKGKHKGKGKKRDSKSKSKQSRRGSKKPGSAKRGKRGGGGRRACRKGKDKKCKK